MSENNMNVDLFPKFLEDNGVTWDKELVEIQPARMNRGLQDTAHACYAIKDCKEGDVIAWIPSSSLLSSKTTAIADTLVEEGLASTLRPECLLAVALMYEAKANESPWEGYLKSLAPSIMAPSRWDAKAKDLLHGTEVENTTRSDTIRVYDDHQKVQLLFPWINDKFSSTVTLVRSHMLRVDDYHHLAMVPFMNLLMKRDDHHKGQARLDVDGCAGECQSCRKNQVGNCSSCSIPYEKKSHQHQDTSGLLDDLEALEEAGVNFYDQHDASNEQDIYYRVVLTRSVKKGDTILYDYGSHSSAEMLTRFGFCYLDNDLEHEKFSVSKEMIFSVCVDTVRDVMHGKQPMTSVATKRARHHVLERFRFYCDKIQYLSLAFTSNHSIIASIFGTNTYALPVIHERYTAINGRYPDDLLVLLHIVFANDALFNSYQANVFVAIGDMRKYLGLVHEQEEGHHAVNGKRARPNPQVEHLQRLVYTACYQLSYRRRGCYEDPEAYLWTPPEMDAYRRDHEQLDPEERYALSCRINEKRAIQKSMKHYDHLIDLCLDDEDALRYGNKRTRSK